MGRLVERDELRSRTSPDVHGSGSRRSTVIESSEENRERAQSTFNSDYVVEETIMQEIRPGGRPVDDRAAMCPYAWRARSRGRRG